MYSSLRETDLGEMLTHLESILSFCVNSNLFSGVRWGLKVKVKSTKQEIKK